jgi:hypothetical protein
MREGDGRVAVHSSQAGERELPITVGSPVTPLSWLLAASAPGSFRNQFATRLEPSGAIDEDDVVLSAVIQRLRAAASRGVGRMGAVARAMTRPAPVVVGLLRDLARCHDELLAEMRTTARVSAYAAAAVRQGDRPERGRRQLRRPSLPVPLRDQRGARGAGTSSDFA